MSLSGNISLKESMMKVKREFYKSGINPPPKPVSVKSNDYLNNLLDLIKLVKDGEEKAILIKALSEIQELRNLKHNIKN